MNKFRYLLAFLVSLITSNQTVASLTLWDCLDKTVQKTLENKVVETNEAILASLNGFKEKQMHRKTTRLTPTTMKAVVNVITENIRRLANDKGVLFEDCIALVNKYVNDKGGFNHGPVNKETIKSYFDILKECGLIVFVAVEWDGVAKHKIVLPLHSALAQTYLKLVPSNKQTSSCSDSSLTNLPLKERIDNITKQKRYLEEFKEKFPKHDDIREELETDYKRLCRQLEELTEPDENEDNGTPPLNLDSSVKTLSGVLKAEDIADDENTNLAQPMDTGDNEPFDVYEDSDTDE